ncbi:MAG: glucose 1-dehydrogenase [Armatimonadetes bacterium]|nr:glucose 1-dehydrogenase [Armatimonadota bacterium]MBS1703197.1 glucose 1-dehydrogenase [Armatimonadota bacterium]MBS1725233.1 glucose 1-dehydrogenase [Armatimonadota bacterium]
MSKKLEGKVAVVTGGSTGIGLATAQEFVNEGATVYITGRRQNQLDEAVKLIGGNVKAVRSDVSNLGDLDSLYETIAQDGHKIDVLFANAGGGELAPLGSITEEQFDKMFDINVKGLLFSVQKALPIFNDGGSIILNASVASIKGMPAFSVYSATKAAVRSFARSWANDLKDRKIRVNSISPGPIDTPIIEGITGSKEGADQFKEQVTTMVPLGRVGEPVEIGRAAVFLASGDSSYVNGVELFVDGGLGQV